MRYGSYLSNASMPIGEAYIQGSPQATLGSSENIYNAGYYTMPWDGHLVVDLWAEVSWPGTNTLGDGAAVWLSVHTYSALPVGVGFNTADLCTYHDCAGIFSYAGELRTHAMWYSVPAGVQVQVNARLYTNIINYVRVAYVGGFCKAVKT